MSFFDEVKAKLTNTGKKAASTAKEASEFGKLRFQLIQEDRKLKNMLANFGLECYAAMRDDSERDLSEQIAEIDAQKAKMDELTQRLSQLKQEKKCPACGATVGKEDPFCKKCGAAFGEEEAEEEKPEE